MAENDAVRPNTKLKATDIPCNDDPLKRVDGASDETDLLHDSIRWENEDKARNLIERGDMGYKPGDKKFPSIIGNGKYVNIWRAAMGDTKQQHEEHLRDLCLADEARHPEIYPFKRMAKSKQDNHRVVPAVSGEKSQEPTHITKDEFINLYSAVSYANGFGVAINVHIIIHWGLLGYTDHAEAANALQDNFFEHLRGWYKYNHEKPVYGVKNPHQLFWIYSHECSKRAGFHTHILAGIPIEMRKAFRDWVKERAAKLSKTQPLHQNAVFIVSPPGQAIDRQWRLFQYICKGLDPNARINIASSDELVVMSGLIQNSYSNPGHIKCKNRIGMSRNLTRKERKKDGFNSLMELGIFDKRKLYTSEMYDSWHSSNLASNGDLGLLDLS